MDRMKESRRRSNFIHEVHELSDVIEKELRAVNDRD